MDINKERSGSKKFIQRNGRAAKEGRGKGKKGKERKTARRDAGKREDRRRERRERGTWQDRGKRGS